MRAKTRLTVENWERAKTATSARGWCRGPTHCCWATNPVTHLSTFVVRKRLLATDGSLRMLPFSGGSLFTMGASRLPTPPLNMIGLIHSLRSPDGSIIPNDLEKPDTTEKRKDSPEA
ncbi:hypothetical protein J437_LFUL003641 [Ladona fulva]|uniref:Uncharacterized protein n=1 Tax=Ladona fulva TaxID=123851 RepID=A0A8K0JW17_LADFU|nr:hypothetical protein J437_LFUL003641 [Ladona fulva]